MEDLSKKDCVLTAEGGERLQGQALHALSLRLGDTWQVIAGKRLRKSFAFADFASALAYVNRVGEMAERQNHHPEIELRWGQVVIAIWTHTVDGLTEADFVFAAKAEALLEDRD